MENSCEPILQPSFCRTQNTNEYTSVTNICSPIKNITELWSCIQKPPAWIDRIIDIYSRSPFVIKNEKLDCHTEVDLFLPKLRLDKNSVPRSLVCHDMKNGYLEDRFINPVNIGNGYTFYRWSQIDIFVYFSHHFITIPPLPWINVAHKNGVKIFGTLITEWDKGKEICGQIFRDVETMRDFANSLADVSSLFKLDGWLLNFENSLDPNYALILLEFVGYFTEKMHKKRPGSSVIWYDSIIRDGTLAWQNELNINNQCFFDACDGIFLNYTWKEQQLINTVQTAKHRALDVYVGVDVFGRNFYGGGKFNTHLAIDLIRKYNLSIAIFAPGWTHEGATPLPSSSLFERFIDRENAFWKSLWHLLYTHPITRSFSTVFYTGVEKNWYKLHDQEVQLSKCLHPANDDSEYSGISPLKEACSCLKVYIHDTYTSCLLTKGCLDRSKSYVHNLFHCDFHINGKAIVYTYTKSILDLCDGSLGIVFILQDFNGVFRRVICHADEHHIIGSNVSLSEVNPTWDSSVINAVRQSHEASNLPPDWTLRCYIVDFKGSRVLQIGAKIDERDAVCLCGFGIVYDSIIENI